MSPTGVVVTTFVVNHLAGYVRYRETAWAPDRFRAILLAPDGIHKRLSCRSWAKAQQAISWGRRVNARMQRWKDSR